MAKYKVGDRVRVRSDLCDGKSYNMSTDSGRQNAVGSMIGLAGEIVTIESVDDYYTVEELGFLWTDGMFDGIVINEEPAEETDQEIKITAKGEKTTAVYKNNGKTVIATAKFSPDDTFDFAEGAKIAFARLWEGEEDDGEQTGYNGKVVCIQRGYNSTCIPIPGLTVGKIYTISDGRITLDDGNQCACRYLTIEALSIGMGHKFIPLVE